MDSTLLYADSLLRQPSAHFNIIVNAPSSCGSPLNSPRSVPSSPTKSHFDFTFSSKPAKTKTAKQQSADLEQPDKTHLSLRDLMKRKIFTKLFRVLTLKDVTGGKTYPRDFRALQAKAKRKRARSSQSSGLSNYEPMLATIIEETESDLASVQSTIHCHHSVYGTLTSQHQHFVDASA